MEIEGVAGGDLEAGAAAVAGGLIGLAFAVDRLRHQAGQGGLADAAHPGKQDGMGNPAAGQAVLQRLDDRALADNLGEGLRA